MTDKKLSYDEIQRIARKFERKFKNERAVFTHLDDYSDAEELEAYENQSCDIVSLEIDMIDRNESDEENFNNCYWNIRFDDDSYFVGIPGIALDVDLDESLKEDKESKDINFVNPELVSWKDMYINEYDVDTFYNDYYDEDDDEYWNETCQAYFDVVDSDNNNLGRICVYKFDSNGYWYEVGFVPNEEFLDVEKLNLEDLDVEADGWFADIKDSRNLLTENDYRNLLKKYIDIIKNALK